VAQLKFERKHNTFAACVRTALEMAYLLQQTARGNERDCFQRGSARRVTGLQHPRRDRPRMALCHLESLVCLPAINALFGAVGDQISLVVLSNRFGGQHGGLGRQLLKSVRRSGLRMTLWLGFDILAAQTIASIAGALGVRRPALLSIRALARRHAAQIVETHDVNGSACLDIVRAHSPDVTIVVNFDQILRRPLIDVAPGGVVNVHPSLLPGFRGPCPVFHAMAAGRHDLGVTVHLIDSDQIDAGPVIAQASVAREPAVSVAEATSTLFVRGVRLLMECLEKDLRSQAAPQERSESTYQTFPTRAEVATARAKGVRLCHWRHVARLVSAALRPSSSVGWR
jgi:methionyl-tRNA formyltransferase